MLALSTIKFNKHTANVILFRLFIISPSSKQSLTSKHLCPLHLSLQTRLFFTHFLLNFQIPLKQQICLLVGVFGHWAFRFIWRSNLFITRFFKRPFWSNYYILKYLYFTENQIASWFRAKRMITWWRRTTKNCKLCQMRTKRKTS